MKKILPLIAAMLCLLPCIYAFADEAKTATPTLTEIEFNNATVNETLSQNNYEYSVTLGNPEITPTLKSYKISSEANIFVSYEQDEARHQTGILITLEYENGSVYYKFRYSNPKQYEINSNNLLSDVQCRLGEVYPKINDNQKEYKLYIPSDLTEINLNVTTQDTGATFDIPKSIMIRADQEPTIMIEVFASNGEKRTYYFDVKRLRKNCAEVQREMESPDFESLVKGELFWQKPSFLIGAACVLAGLILFAIFVKIAKRLTVTVEDEDEKSFFA